MTHLRTVAFAAVLALCGATDAFAVCTGQFQAGSVCANAGASQAVPGPTASPVLGLPGTTGGSLGFAGAGSGTATVQTQSAAGTPTLLWPTASGTLASTASAPLALNAVTGALTCATCVTSSGGGAITGVAPVAVSAAGAVSITGAAGQVLAGSAPAFTATPVLGASGTVGTIGFGNATSGTVTLGTVAGALGSVTASLPANTGIIAETNYAQTWSAGQTFSAAITYGGVTLSNSVVGTGSMVLSTGPSISGLTVTSSFTATGLVTNADLTNSSITLGSTAMALGSTNTTIAGAISWSGIQSITNNTASTSPSTGAVVVTGGVGITGAIYSLGSISTTGSDVGFAAGGNRAMMDVTGTTARIGAVYGGGSAMSLNLLCGSASTCLSISSAGLVSIGSGLTVTSSFTATGLVTTADLATQVANTVLGNFSGSTVSPSANTMPSCSGASQALNYTSGGGATAIGCVTISTSGVAGWGLALSGSTFSVATTNPPYGFDAPVNLSLTASVGSNILTITVTGNNGSTPSAPNPVLVAFRDTTLTNGDPVWVPITSALSMTTNATGATLGSSSGNVPFRFWIVIFNNAGTPVLALINCSTATATAVNIYPLAEHILQSTTGISGSATSAGVFYTPNGTSLTSKAFRIVGYLEYASGLTTAGTYASVPTIVQLFGPGVKKPGDTVQGPYMVATNSATATASASLATTNLTFAISPTSTVNLIHVTANNTGSMANGGSPQSGSVQLQRGATLIGPQALLSNPVASTTLRTNVGVDWIDGPATTGSTTYAIYTSTSGGTFSYPVGNTTIQGNMTIREIQG